MSPPIIFFKNIHHPLHAASRHAFSGSVESRVIGRRCKVMKQAATAKNFRKLAIPEKTAHLSPSVIAPSHPKIIQENSK
jgi:hypothetical protein